MKPPATIEKFKQGPVGMLTIFPQRPASHAEVPGDVVRLLPGYQFFRCLSHRAHRGHGNTRLAGLSRRGHLRLPRLWLGGHQHSIWKGQPWIVTIKETFDGLIYAC